MTNLHVNPNVLLDNTISLIAGLSKLDFSDEIVYKLNKLSEKARRVKKINPKTYTNISRLKKLKKNIPAKIMHFKMEQNNVLNQLGFKILDPSGHKMHGGFVHDYSVLYPMKLAVRKMISNTMNSMFHFVKTRGIVLFSKNDAKAFLEASALAKPNKQRKFINICLLIGLSKKTNVASVLGSEDTQVIQTFIDKNISLKSDDLMNLQTLPGVLLSGFIYAHNSHNPSYGISLDDLDNLEATCLGFISLQSEINPFELKTKLDLTGTQVDEDLESKFSGLDGYLMILGFIKKSLDRLVKRNDEIMDTDENAKFVFVNTFIGNCIKTLKASHNFELVELVHKTAL